MSKKNMARRMVTREEMTITNQNEFYLLKGNDHVKCHFRAIWFLHHYRRIDSSGAELLKAKLHSCHYEFRGVGTEVAQRGILEVRRQLGAEPQVAVLDFRCSVHDIEMLSMHRVGAEGNHRRLGGKHLGQLKGRVSGPSSRGEERLERRLDG